MFKTPKEISDEYGINLSTVYYRVHSGVYRTDKHGKILEEDVLNTPPTKKGRKPKI